MVPVRCFRSSKAPCSSGTGSESSTTQQGSRTCPAATKVRRKLSHGSHVDLGRSRLDSRCHLWRIRIVSSVSSDRLLVVHLSKILFPFLTDEEQSGTEYKSNQDNNS